MLTLLRLPLFRLRADEWQRQATADAPQMVQEGLRPMRASRGKPAVLRTP